MLTPEIRKKNNAAILKSTSNSASDPVATSATAQGIKWKKNATHLMPFWANSTLASPIVGTMHLGPHLRQTPPHHWRLHHFFLPYIFEQKNGWTKLSFCTEGVPENQVVWWRWGEWFPAINFINIEPELNLTVLQYRRLVINVYSQGDKPSSHCNLLKGSWQKKGSWGKPHTINSTNGAFAGHIWRTGLVMCTTSLHQILQTTLWKIPSGVQQKNSKSSNINTSMVMIYMLHGIFPNTGSLTWQNHPWKGLPIIIGWDAMLARCWAG